METIKHEGRFVKNPFGIPERSSVQQVVEESVAIDSRQRVLANLMEEVRKSGGCNNELFSATIDALVPRSNGSVMIFEETYL